MRWLLVLLLAGCASGPPIQVAGTWEGWAESSYDVRSGTAKTGFTLVLKQDGRVVNGTYKATIVQSARIIVEEGEVTGRASGRSVVLQMEHGKGEGTSTRLAMNPDLSPGQEAGKRVLEGWSDPGRDSSRAMAHFVLSQSGPVKGSF